jgi:hypothetical protein
VRPLASIPGGHDIRQSMFLRRARAHCERDAAAFLAAWLSAYAKRGGTWLPVATANTMRDGA